MVPEYYKQNVKTNAPVELGSKKIIWTSIKILLLILVIGCSISFFTKNSHSSAKSSQRLFSSSVVNEVDEGLSELSLDGASVNSYSLLGVKDFITRNFKNVEKIFSH